MTDYSLLDFAFGYSDDGAHEHRDVLEEPSKVAKQQHRDIPGRFDVDRN